MASRKVRSDENVNKCDDKVNKSDAKCGVCSKKVTSNDDGVQCELCSAWFHCKCQQVSIKMYDVLEQFKYDIHWFCNGCNEKAGSILSFISNLQDKVGMLEGELHRIRQNLETECTKTCSSLKAEIDKLSKLVATNDKKLREELDQSNKKTEDVWSNMDGTIKQFTTDLKKLGSRADHCEKTLVENTKKETWADIVARVDDEVENKMIKVAQEVESKMIGVTVEMTLLQKRTQDIQADREEQEEISKRKNSIIIHGLSESLSANGSSRCSEDNDHVMDMLNQINCPTVSVNSCIRLGKLPSDQTQKPRPLKIVLSSEDQKDRVLRYAKNLKGMGNGLDKVFLHQDLTPKQRAHRQMLVKELKDRQQKGELNLMIVADKIVKRKYKTDAGITELKTV
jgi:phage host-nuclease inhibitor protein Gam